MGRHVVLRADARSLPLPSNSIDCIITSPPYYQLRDYSGGEGSLAGQLGAEETPAEYVDNLVACTAEMARVLKPSGSIWINLGDKFGRGARRTVNNGEGKRGHVGDFEVVPTGSPKGLLGLPWRYAFRCVDELGLILRQEIIWSKANAMPESVLDRTNRTHEQWFHFTLSERYYANLDAIREEYDDYTARREAAFPNWDGERKPSDKARINVGTSNYGNGPYVPNVLGKLPGSVRHLGSEPLRLPEWVAHVPCCGARKRPGCDGGLEHWASFPTVWPRWIVSGWCPAEVCTACGQGRRLQSSARRHRDGQPVTGAMWRPEGKFGTATGRGHRERTTRRVVGTVCECPDVEAPTAPAQVLDPFGGTGTTALVADVLGRTGISADLSPAYNTIARWRCSDPGQRRRAAGDAVPAAVAARSAQQRPALAVCECGCAEAEHGRGAWSPCLSGQCGGCSEYRPAAGRVS